MTRLSKPQCKSCAILHLSGNRRGVAAVKVPIEIERELEVEGVPIERARILIDDLEGTIKRFPKLRELKPLGGSAYLWEMDPIGTAGIEHEVSYAAEYEVSPEQGLVSFTPVRGHGNALIEGYLKVVPGQDNGLQLSFRVKGTLYDVPVPLVYRLAAPPVIQGIFKRLVERYLEKLRDAVSA